jgi:hypothetical protein
MTTSVPNPNQINTSVIGMFSAMLSAVFATIVTTAVRSNDLVNKTFNVVINGMSAAEHVSIAIDKRAEIYGKGLVDNGVLAERETLLKQKLRLAVLEQQEISARTPQPAKAKPVVTTKSKSKATKPEAKVHNAA